MKASLYQKSRGTVGRAGLDDQDVDVELSWHRADPIALSLSVTENGGTTPWEVARTLVVAALREPMRGCWVGYSDVACHARGEEFRFAFYPRRPRPVFLRMRLADVATFVEHAERILPSHGIEEQVIILAEIERDLSEMFG